MSVGLRQGYMLRGVESAYKTLEPVPYWPDNGQAHTTCKALPAASAAGVTAFRPTRVFSSEVEDRTGMPLVCLWEKMVLTSK